MLKRSESEVVDLTGRSIELKNLWNIIKKLSKQYGVLVMSEFGLEFKTHGGISQPVALPLQTHRSEYGRHLLNKLIIL